MPPITHQHKEEISRQNIAFQQKQVQESAKFINNIIFVVGTGTFVLSISFIGYLDTVILYPQLLVASWVFLFFAIVSTVASHAAAIFHSKRMIDLLNAHRSSGFKTEWNMVDSGGDEIYLRLAKWGNGLYIVAGLTLIAGLIFLIFFAAINFLALNEIRKYEKEHSVMPGQQNSESTTTSLKG